MLSHRLQTERLDGVEKFVTIFKRTGKGRALEVYRTKFPRKALAVFSEVWKKEIDREGNAGLLIIEDASGNMLPYDLILNWIDLCIDEGNDIKFPEVSTAAFNSDQGIFRDHAAINPLGC